MARRAAATRIGSRVNLREFKLFPLESRIAFKEILFSITLIEHPGYLIHADSCAFDDRRSTADFRIGHDHALRLLEF